MSTLRWRRWCGSSAARRSRCSSIDQSFSSALFGCQALHLISRSSWCVQPFILSAVVHSHGQLVDVLSSVALYDIRPEPYNSTRAPLVLYAGRDLLRCCILGEEGGGAGEDWSRSVLAVHLSVSVRTEPSACSHFFELDVRVAHAASFSVSWLTSKRTGTAGPSLLSTKIQFQGVLSSGPLTCGCLWSAVSAQVVPGCGAHTPGYSAFLPWIHLLNVSGIWAFLPPNPNSELPLNP